MDRTPQLLQNTFLEKFRVERTPVFIFLVTGIKLQGYIEFFDNYVIAVRSSVTQIVYKHAISTVIPAPANASESTQPKTPVIVRKAPPRKTWSEGS